MNLKNWFKISRIIFGNFKPAILKSNIYGQWWNGRDSMYIAAAGMVDEGWWMNAFRDGGRLQSLANERQLWPLINLTFRF